MRNFTAVFADLTPEEIAEIMANPKCRYGAHADLAAALELAGRLAEAKRREPLPIRSPSALSESEFRLFALGWMECEAAHGMVE